MFRFGHSLFNNAYGGGGGGSIPALWNNLLAYYTADNTPNDAVGSANGTLINGATYGSGIINQGFSLDGVNDYVDLGDNFNFDFSLPFSISLWANVANASNQMFFSKTDTTGGISGFIFRTMSGGTVRLGLYNLGSFTSLTTTNSLTTGGFTHIVATNDGQLNGSGIKIYFDGVSQTLVNNGSNLTGGFNTTTPAYLGRYSSSYFNGVMDEVAIFNRELTASDVTDLYNSGAGRQYPT